MSNLTVAQSHSIIAADAFLANAVGDALFTCETPPEHMDICTQCAATLYAQQWLQVEAWACGDPGGLITTDELIKNKTAEAVVRLRMAGVLPAGWLAWMLSIALRRDVWAFLEALVREWLEGDGS